MNELLLLFMFLICMNAALIETKEIKKTIVIKQVNGKTHVYGLDQDGKVDNERLKFNEIDLDDELVIVNIEADQKKTTHRGSKNNPRQGNGPG